MPVPHIDIHPPHFDLITPPTSYLSPSQRKDSSDSVVAMVTPVTNEKMDDRYSTIQLSHSRHAQTNTHKYIREQHNGNVGNYRQREGEAVGALRSQWLFTTVKKKKPCPPHPTHTSTSKCTLILTYTSCIIQCYWLIDIQTSVREKNTPGLSHSCSAELLLVSDI